MTKIDLDELEHKAKAALQSTWSPDDPNDPQDVLDDERGKLVVRCYRAPIAANTLHIAAASPPVMLALIARIRRLEAELARAAGVVRARGADDYADDFMRVAQDREDFDAEVGVHRALLGKDTVLP